MGQGQRSDRCRQEGGDHPAQAPGTDGTTSHQPARWPLSSSARPSNHRRPLCGSSGSRSLALAEGDPVRAIPIPASDSCGTARVVVVYARGWLAVTAGIARPELHLEPRDSAVPLGRVHLLHLRLLPRGACSGCSTSSLTPAPPPNAAPPPRPVGPNALFWSVRRWCGDGTQGMDGATHAFETIYFHLKKAVVAAVRHARACACTQDTERHTQREIAPSPASSASPASHRETERDCTLARSLAPLCCSPQALPSSPDGDGRPMV
eukprot:COSAG01_NODE_744_length_13876_cov_4.660449_11_plen_264_part_00